MRSLALVVVLLGCGVKPSLVGDGGPGEVPTRASLAFSPDQADIAPGAAVAMFTLTNTGLDTTGTIGLEVTGTDSPSFELVSSSCTVLTAGATCAATIKLVPRKTGALTATLRASDGNVDTTAMLHSPGVSANNGLLITAPTGPFPITAVKNDSPPLAFTVTNLGTSPTGQLTATVDATNPQFAIGDPGDTCTGMPLAPQGTCTIPVTFSPRGSGSVTRAGLLTVTDQAAATATQVLTAHTGQIALPSTTTLPMLAGAACASPMAAAQIAFSNETWTGTTMSVALNGNNASSFMLNTTCVPTLATGAMCTATVTPIVTDAATMTTLSTNLVVTATQAAVSQMLTLPITANLGPCDLQITPSSLQFGSVAPGTHPPVTRSFTVTNLSPTVSYVLGTSLGGVDMADYAIVTDTCLNKTLPPSPTSLTCSVTLAFDPAATDVGARTANVAVTATGLAPPPVLLAGTGVASALTASPEMLMLSGTVGQVATSRTVTLTTTAVPGAVNFTITPPFTLSPAPNCTTLAPGTPCMITVGFTPAVTGTVTGTLSITSAVGGATVALTGTGN